MNGGVKVPTLNDKAIEHLKVLQDKGVELLICGACLNFYGLEEIIGAGNDELGKSLMKMFIYTISEGEDLPKSILFMNGGVKVPTLNDQAIEHLKVLQDKGVELLICGACLNFYGLEEKLEVGKISNMYDITNSTPLSCKTFKCSIA